METSNNHAFTVRNIDEDYSNARNLLVGHEFKVGELADHKISIVPDAKLASFVEGNIPDEIFIQNIEAPILLQKNEKVAFYLKGISYCEERGQLTRGVWYHNGNLTLPHYSNEIKKIDTGALVITSIRFVFIGLMKIVDQPHSKIDAITSFKNGIRISHTNKRKTEYFIGDYHWPPIASVFMGLAKKNNQG
jgi:hypothetical protein